MNVLKNSGFSSNRRNMIMSAQVWPLLLPVLLLGFLLRLVLAIYSENVFYADEIFQYLEPAHKLVYGYGYEAWEYRFGLRSWVLPYFIAVFLYPCKWLGLGANFYIPLVKGVFCLLSSSLILSSYFVTKGLFSTSKGEFGEKAARFAALLSVFWYELIFFAHKPFTEVLATYAFMGAFAFVFGGAGMRRSLIFGILCGLVLCLRMHYAPALAVLVLYYFFRNAWRDYLLVSHAVLAVIIFFACVDWFSWGMPFASFYNNFFYNVVLGLSKTFGVSPFFEYFQLLDIASAKLFWLALLMALFCVRATFPALLIMLVVLLSHSALEHKEYRFIFLLIPLTLCFLAIFFAFLTNLPHLPFWKLGKRVLLALVFVGYLLLSFAGACGVLPDIAKIYKFPIWYRDEILLAKLELAKLDKLKSIYNNTDVSVYDAGGYYYLNRKVLEFFHSRSKIIGTKRQKFMRVFSSHIIDHKKAKPVKSETVIRQYDKIKILEKKYADQVPAKLVSEYLSLKTWIDRKYQSQIKNRHKKNWALEKDDKKSPK